MSFSVVCPAIEPSVKFLSRVDTASLSRYPGLQTRRTAQDQTLEHAQNFGIMVGWRVSLGIDQNCRHRWGGRAQGGVGGARVETRLKWGRQSGTSRDARTVGDGGQTTGYFHQSISHKRDLGLLRPPTVKDVGWLGVVMTIYHNCFPLSSPLLSRILG